MDTPNLTFRGLNLSRALYGGIIAAIIIGASSYFAGSVGREDGLDLISEMRPSLRFACAAMLTATSTILALILTLLGFSSNRDKPLRAEHYVRIQWISRFAIGTFIGAIVLLLLLAIPIEHGEVDNIGQHYDFFYYFYLVYGALLAGTMVAIILMLYTAATEIIILVHPDKEADFLLMKDKEDVAEDRTEAEQDRQEEASKKTTEAAAEE